MNTPATSKLGRKYGLRPPRSLHPLVHSCRVDHGFSGAILNEVDHRPLLTPVRDQGQEGSCFAHATAALKEFNCAIWGGGVVPLGAWLSVAYLSWRTRSAEGTFPDDSGASLADAMAVLQAYGVCPESFLPYNQNPAEAGNASCDVAARPYRVADPVMVHPTVQAFQTVLSAKKVIAVGFEVFTSFEDTGADGIVPMPKDGEGQLGGHAVLVVGYKLINGAPYFIVRNSWGSGWGDGGHCYWSPAYLGLCFEAWTTA